MKNKVVSITKAKERPPLPGVKLLWVNRAERLCGAIATPDGVRYRFESPEYDISIEGEHIHVRKGDWHVGFSSIGCDWFFVIEQVQ